MRRVSSLCEADLHVCRVVHRVVGFKKRLAEDPIGTIPRLDFAVAFAVGGQRVHELAGGEHKRALINGEGDVWQRLGLVAVDHEHTVIIGSDA